MTLRKYENLLEAQNKRQSLIDGLQGIKTDKLNIDARIEGLQAEVDLIDACELCGSPKEAWTL